MNSTFTRFRVQTVAPLEPLKAWHAISPELDIKYVHDLTTNISQALGLTEVDGEIVLELDGFILLPSSPAGVVRDGDIVTVRCKPRADKRKATEDQPTKRQKTQSPVVVSSLALAPPATTAKQPTKLSLSSEPGSSRIAAPANPVVARSKPASSSSEEDTTSSDSDSTSEDDSESSSDSSSESSSDSDSDSGSDSDSETGPTPQPIPRQPLISARQTPVSKTPIAPPPARKAPSQPPVPPGEGKPSTKSRNARRRALQKHLAAGTTLSPEASRTSTPASKAPTPVLVSEAVVTTQVRTSTPIAPAKNANKNKRKGFDKDMAESVATRITYVTPAPAAISVEPPSRVDSPAITGGQTKSRYTHYHVVPPSQLKDLPSNVIVTSVDVEAVDGLEGVGEWFDGENRNADQEMDVTDDTPTAPNATDKKVDWEAVDSEWERSWDSFPTVGEAVWKDLQPGNLLAYKSLTIDPTTCTPCTKIHLARIVSGPSGTGEAQCFFIDRPGAGDIGFGFGGKFGGPQEAEDEVGDEETGETRGVAFSEAQGWKVVA